MLEPKIKIEEVEVTHPRLFPLPESVAPPPRVLVTSAFHPNAERSHNLNAAHEVGDVLQHLPFHVEVDIHPCITCEALPDMLRNASFAAWIHLSHGKQQRGLYEASLRRYASKERWLASFRAYQKNLSLVLFSSCQSASVAELFARSGVGVAIGFESNVLSVAPRILTEPVVRATILSGGAPDSIMRAYVSACNQLAAKTIEEEGSDESYLDAGPIAYLSKP